MRSKFLLFNLLLNLFLVLFYAEHAMAQNIRWDLQVTDPDFELVNYKLEDQTFKPYLKKTSWRCETGETEKKNSLEIKKLTCDYSIEKAGTVSTIVSCSDQRPYSEGNLELFDERKNLTFKVMLTCRVIKTP